MITAANCPIITTPATAPGFLGAVSNDILTARFNHFKKHEDKEKVNSDLWLLRHKRSGEAQPEGAATNRLVTTRKSPTDVNDRITVARFYAREWSGEQRVSVESFTRLQEAPAPNVGDRWTEGLTARAVRAIIDSGAYVATTRGGFSTFLTLTFDEQARERILKIKPIRQVDEGKPGQQCGEHEAAGKFCHLPTKGDFCSGVQASGVFTRIDFNTESTIGQEVSRFFDAMQKKYQRGWTWEPSKEEKKQRLLKNESEKIPPKWDVRHSDIGPVRVPEKLDFIWVAENPDRWEYVVNYHGETCKSNTAAGTNPHVHVLMRWAVPREYFLGWAEQIEELWGQGFAHLEKIRNPKAAGNYMLKALGYMTKAAHSYDPNTGELCISQGRIRGNRYNISASARAPGWECIAEFEAEKMGQVVAEIGQLQKQIQSELTSELKAAQEMKKKAAADLARFQRYKLPSVIKNAHLKRISRRLENAKQEIEQIQDKKASEAWGNRYKVTFRSTDQVQSFLSHAITTRGWTATALEWSQKGINRAVKLKEWAKTTGQKIVAAVERETVSRLADVRHLLVWADYFMPPTPAKPEPWNGWEPVYCWESGL